MSERLKAMRRLVRVHDQVKRLAEAELHATEARLSAIETAATGLDALMGDPDLSPRLVNIAMGQRRVLAVRQADAERLHAQQVEATREIRGRGRLGERMVEDLAREAGRVEERRDLERVMETLLGRMRAPDDSLR